MRWSKCDGHTWECHVGDRHLCDLSYNHVAGWYVDADREIRTQGAQPPYDSYADLGLPLVKQHKDARLKALEVMQTSLELEIEEARRILTVITPKEPCRDVPTLEILKNSHTRQIDLPRESRKKGSSR